VARYWVWQRLSKNPAAASSLYSFAWYSNDARFWTAIIGTASPSATFTQETAKQTQLDGTTIDRLVWYVTFPNLTKVPLPPPEEWMHHELRWTNALADINAARSRIIDQIVGMDYLSTLGTEKAVELGQAFALASANHKEGSGSR
jgi:hypothetical protein